MSKIDPQAVVDEAATLGAGVEIGPYCVVGPEVTLGDRCRLLSHVVVEGSTEIGPETVISPFASVGGAPQDLRYKGEDTRLIIGARNTIRENTTLNRGTPHGGGVTRLGDGNLVMAYSHVGHDCQIGDDNILANGTTLAGHVEIGSHATVGAYSGVHQFCRVADHAFIGGFTVLRQDALPWVTTVGNRAKSYGLNIIGLRRRGYSKETIQALKHAYTTLFRSKLRLNEALDALEDSANEFDEVRYFIDFVRGSERGVTR
ncbi:MAG: acyl-ACP--UDP-N-acetylglucosamine O-acyltransferase [Acidobacteria bacterium]|nr:acyl-ACP--UDP-N-acetylglucosamine O-acyltransferase [Acidobacteriota bacterium]NIM64251.1 acyl-ACP--UDP-N-acetylglucosamine O-acyltransferase [Acidobacteriota bacterium]NIO59249.1 acyl-ACP--UDP-N-acetylglucosamine O-acyltransferase [Acidobacteriota bacterium]NIQ30276.1 acyl-ACP--UDP-N-acetylglucosamine O-acyltransferase [Acidobacteriota bacterium]NIQ85204.1 acyl-ACP--UDP-N-acetylglucosamine O-acyltransferase [Acidobacteriota bacterium]